jgi:nucleoside-diphosphate-sugar epimerase
MKSDRGIIIVSGSNGRIGDAVMRRFSGRFDDVVGFDRKAPQPAPPGCVYVAVDITSDESVRDGLRTIHAHHGAHVASVIHLAAYYDFFGKPSSKYEEITVQGTGRLLRELRAQDFRVEQLVFSSTMLVTPSGRARPAHRRGLADRADLGLPGFEGPDRAAHP